MSFTIKKSDGTTLTTVPENETVTNAASVALVGRGATTYGVSHAENFVHLTENFAHTVPPANALEGQLWYDKNISAMKVRKGNNWELVGSGGGGTGTNVGGPVYVQIGETSVMALVAGGQVISVLSPSNIAVSLLPISITILSNTIPFQSRFPYGIEAGQTLAYDAEDYVYQGHVPLADASVFTGGGNPFAATTFVDLGPTSVALSISNNVIIAAYSAAVVPASMIPVNFTVNNITMPFKAVFPTGMVSGLTLGVNYGIQATGLNSSNSSTEIINQLVATFTTGTGQSTLAQAIQYLIVSAGEGTANAAAGITLRSEFTSALGTVNFAEALTKIATSVNAGSATASDLTSLQAAITTAYTSAIATATQNMLTTADLNSASAGVLSALQANFESLTGYSSIASAVNDLKLVATGTGSVVTQDTDFRTQFTNALQNGEAPGTINSVAKAMDKLKLFSGADKATADRVTGIESAFKTLTGTGTQDSVASAINKLATTTSVNSAIATNNTALKANIANELHNGSTTIADAITEVIASVSANPNGSTSIVDTQLRNILVAATNESGDPVTEPGQAIYKLMNNTPKDRLNASNISELQGALTGSTGQATVAAAANKLQSTVNQAASNSSFITALQSALATQTGQATWNNAIDYLSTAATTSNATASKVSNIESNFLSTTGQTSVASAISTLWTRANSAGAAAGWSLDLNSDGTIAGLELVANAATKQSSFIIKADQFKIYSPGSPNIVPFRVENNTVYMDTAIIQDLTVGTRKITASAVTTFVAIKNTNRYYGSGYGAGGAGNAGSGGGGDSGGGGGFGCVALDSFMPSGDRARYVTVGSPLTMLKSDDSGSFTGTVTGFSIITQPCYRVRTESGITLVASVTTPITSRNGVVHNIQNAGGVEVPVMDNGKFGWEKIVFMEFLGNMEVANISADDGTYAAGEKSGRYIFTHNKAQNGTELA